MLRSLFFLSLAGTAWTQMTSTIQGDGQCGIYMCVNATVQGDKVLYEMTGLQEPLGYLAIGFGTKMVDTAMVIMWPNEDGSITLSQRRALEHSEPLPVMYPPRLAKVAEPRVSTLWHPKAVKTLAFTVMTNTTLLSLSDPTERLIWAYSKVRPEKVRWSELTQHYTAGFLRLNLGGTMPDFVPTVEPAPPANLPPYTGAIIPEGSKPALENSHVKHQAIIIAHGVLASIGFLVFLPAGSLFARWGRTITPNWFRVHQTINMSIALPVITLGWILGPIAVIQHQTAHLFDAHQVTGVFLLILYYLQVSLGRYIHSRKASAPPNAPHHPPSNIMHIALGLLVITLAFVQTRSGMKEWRTATGQPDIAHWCHVLWNVWAVTIPVLYVAGTIMLRRQFFQEQHGLSPGSGNYLALSPTAPEHRVAFEISDDEVLDKSLSRNRTFDSRQTKEYESNVPLLSSQSQAS